MPMLDTPVSPCFTSLRPTGIGVGGMAAFGTTDMASLSMVAGFHDFASGISSSGRSLVGADASNRASRLTDAVLFVLFFLTSCRKWSNVRTSMSASSLSTDA